MTLAKVGDGAKIRRVKADHAHEVDPLTRRLGDPPRRVDAVAIGVKQQRRHHRRIKRRLPALAPVGSLDLPKVKMIEDQPNDKARQVVRADKVLHARRKQQRFGNLPGAECLAHPQQNPIRSTPASKIRYYPDRLLAYQAQQSSEPPEPSPLLRAYKPRAAAIEAIPNLKSLWRAKSTEDLEIALDNAQSALLQALESSDPRMRIVAARLMLKTRHARERGWS